MGIFHNGRYYIKPAVLTYVDDTALTPVGLVGANVIGMMGPAKDGIPNQAYLLASLSDATDIFGEGPLVDGVAMAFNGGAQYIWATRVGGTYDGTTHAFTTPPAQAVYATSDTPNCPFSLLSNAYGSHANGIQVITNKNATKGIDVTVEAQGNEIVGTQVYYDVLKIVNGGSAELSIAITQVSTAYNLVATYDGTPTAAIDLVGVATTTDLVERIKAAMTAVAIDSTLFTFTVMKEMPAVQLDYGTVTFTAGNTNYLTANVKAVFDWLNSGSQPYVYAEDSGDIFTTSANKDQDLLRDATDTSILFTFSFASASTQGSYGVIDESSYQGVFNEIYEDLDIDLMVPIVDTYLTYTVASADPNAVFSYLLTHCKEMSTLNSEERIGLTGYQFEGLDPAGTTATTDGNDDTLTDTLIAKAMAVNSPYIVICAPRLKTFDLKGNLKFFNGTYTAAYIAGLIASFNVGEPITNKVVSGVQALSTYFKNRQILQLIDNGVCVIERIGGSLKVVQGVTSWISDDNFNRKEISVRLVTNYIAKNCRAALAEFIGRKNSPQILQMIKGALIQVLRELENEEIIVGTDDYPAFRNMTLTQTGDVVRVSFECSPVLPINYITISLHCTIFSQTI